MIDLVNTDFVCRPTAKSPLPPSQLVLTIGSLVLAAYALPFNMTHISCSLPPSLPQLQWVLTVGSLVLAVYAAYAVFGVHLPTFWRQGWGQQGPAGGLSAWWQGNG